MHGDQTLRDQALRDRALGNQALRDQAFDVIESDPPPAPAISVLTPVCNMARYLPECLDSLMAQTFGDLEFICLNDGSTDESLDILRAYQARDARFRIVDKPNSGYGATMNLGIALARGTYVGILESDDFADPDLYATLHRFASWHDCDLVKCSYYEHSEAGDVKQRPFARHRLRTVFDPREREFQWVLGELPIIWAALYRRALLVDNRVRFNETPGASYQDTSFVFQCWASARRAALLPNCLIHYRVDNAASSVKSNKKVFAVCDEYALSEAFLDEDPARKEAFGEMIQLIKLGTYRWNYERIDEAGKIEFAAKMAEEYRAADAAGLLDRALFAKPDWQALHELMDDPRAFVARHPEVFGG